MDELPGLKEVVTDPPNNTQAPWLYLVAVIFLGLIALTTVIGSIILTAQGKTVPDGLFVAGGTAVGLLGGLLAKGK